MKYLKLEPAAIGAFAAAAYAVVALVVGITQHQPGLDWTALPAGILALYQAYTRMVVTPLARPRNNAGQPLEARVAAGPVPPGKQA